MFTSKTRIIALALASLALFQLPATAQMDHSKMGDTSAASSAYMDAMMKMNADMDAMQMTGKPGADFALMMIPTTRAPSTWRRPISPAARMIPN